MINLLPLDEKRNLKAARSNVKLLRYCFLLGLAVVFLAGIFGVGYIITSTAYQREIKSKEASDASVASYQDIKKDVDEFQGNLKIAEQILSSEIVYSDLVFEITKTLPETTILTSLTIEQASFGQSFSIDAAGRSFNDALVLKDTLDKSPYFSNVSIVNTTESDQTEGILSDYPVSILINATLLTVAELKELVKEL